MDIKDPPTMNVVLTNEIVDYLKARAKTEDRTVSATVRKILEAEMSRQPVELVEAGDHP